MPILARYGNFPDPDTEATLYTPNRALGPRFDPKDGHQLGDPGTEMMVVHTHPLEIGTYYRISGRVLRIESISDYKEFRARCNAPRLLRETRYRFYFAIPAIDIE